jgi:purine-binding chemotaxis protein CheW
MNNLYLIVRIGDRAAALPAAQVGSVVEVDEIAPVPRAPAHVAGLFALRSRVLTVIDTRVALGMEPADSGKILNAVIVSNDGHSYALLVDHVDDVIEAGIPEASPAVLDPVWEEAGLGVIHHGEAVVLVLEPSILIAGRLTKAA